MLPPLRSFDLSRGLRRSWFREVAIWARFGWLRGAELRRHWRGTVVVMLLVGLVGAVTLAALAGRPTQQLRAATIQRRQPFIEHPSPARVVHAGTAGGVAPHTRGGGCRCCRPALLGAGRAGAPASVDRGTDRPCARHRGRSSAPRRRPTREPQHARRDQHRRGTRRDDPPRRGRHHRRRLDVAAGRSRASAMGGRSGSTGPSSNCASWA